MNFRTIFSLGVQPIDKSKPILPTLPFEISDMVGNWLDIMKIEDGRQEHKNKFNDIRIELGRTPMFNERKWNMVLVRFRGISFTEMVLW